MYIVERIGDSAEVRTLFLALLPQILILMRSKHRDPLDLLSEYIAKVSTMNLCLFDSDHVNLSRNVQRAPSCDMVLVHDGDLEGILRGLDRTVSKHHPIIGKFLIPSSLRV